MAINSISFPTPQAFSGGVDFAPLANLGNVYRQGQQNRLADMAFSQMTGDPQHDAMLLIKSSHPDLVPIGVKMLGQQQQRAEDIREFGITSGQKERELALKQQEFEQGKPQTAQQRYDILNEQVKAGRLPPDYLSRPEVQAHIATGQALPVEKPELSAHEETLAQAADTRSLAAKSTLQAIQRMKELADSTWSGYAADVAPGVEKLLPSGMVPQGALDVREYNNLAKANIAGNAKAAFGNRITNQDLKLLSDIETSADIDPRAKKTLLGNLEKRIQMMQDQADREAEGIRNRTYFKPGGGKAAPTVPPTGVPDVPTTPPPAAVPPVRRAAPSLGEWMTAARRANPGVGDAELAREWKRKYGGGEERPVAGAAAAPPVSF